MIVAFSFEYHSLFALEFILSSDSRQIYNWQKVEVTKYWLGLRRRFPEREDW